MPDALTPLYGPDLGLSPNGSILGDFGRVPQTLAALVAAGTALTASSTETALGSAVIPPDFLERGSVVRIRWQGIATATNATDTLTVRAYIGGIGGTTLFTHTATDVANNDVFSGEYELVIRTIGSSGTMVGFGWAKGVPAAEGTATFRDDILASTTINTTVAQAITISGQWSSTSAGNSCRLDILNVTVA